MGGPAKDRWIGATLGNGRYKIARKLGEGGMGSVYVAWDANLRTEVVVKVPHATHEQDPEATARFVREAASLVKLSHPHIVKIVDFGEQSGQPYAVMQFLSGGSLATRQGEEGAPRKKLSAESLKDWLPSIAKALDFVHAQGYLHRDVKPANILFDPYGNAFLSDFGITKFAAARQAANSGKSLTGLGMVVGTPEYMAPEVILGQPVDGRLDQYGLAVTVFEVLAGRRPFEDATATAVLVQHTVQQPPDIRSLNGDVSPALAAVIRQALAKEPSQRFANCGAFADAAIAAISVTGTSHRETGEIGRAKLRCPACQKSLKIEGKLQGKTVPCPACQTPLRVSDDLRHVSLANAESLADRARGGTRAVVAADLSKQPRPPAAGDVPAQPLEESVSHPDDFWETDGELLPPLELSPTQSIAAAEIPTQTSQMDLRRKTSTQRKSAPRKKQSGLSRNQLLVIFGSAAVVAIALVGVSAYVVSSALRSPTAVTADKDRPTSAPATDRAARRALPVESPSAFGGGVTRASTNAAPAEVRAAIFDIDVLPPSAQLSVENPGVSITVTGGRRHVVVSDPKSNSSITLNLSADGYRDLHHDLAPQPGQSAAFSLALEPSQPKGFDRPEGDNQREAQKSISAKPQPQVASIEPKPKPLDLSQALDDRRTEAPDPFDGNRPGNMRMDNGLKTTLLWIPPGRFFMGTPPEQGKRPNEGPVEVTLTHGFWLAKHEVTQSEWQSVMHTAPWHGRLYVEEAENDAASYINWDEAIAFCKELTKQEQAARRLPANWQYALPTEAEWEYACRAGTTTPFSFGKAVSQLADNGWFAKNASSRHEEYAHRVGGLNSNPWGLDDVHGNVSEWCRDSYTQALPGGSDPEVVANGSQRVLRGGGWRSNFDDCRSASRNRAEATARSPAWGFRIAAVKHVDLPSESKRAAVAETKTSEAVNELVLQSHQMIQGLNFDAARKTLEKASNMDQSSSIADCTLGLLFSICSPDKRSPKLAEQRFRIALRRSPGDVATLNNLALADIHLRKYADAVRCFKQAAEKSPDSEEVVHNLGRFVSEARNKKIHPPTTVLNEATRIQGKLAGKSAGRANSRTGWLYVAIKDQPTLPLGGADIYEDHCCTACNGKARVPCPHCNHGAIVVDQTQSGVMPTPFGALPYSDTTAVQRQCRVCGGTGYVHCPYCSNGYDRGGR